MKEIEKKLNGLINSLVDSSGKTVPDGVTYRDISKVVCEGYASQELVTIKVFFYSKGKMRNNKPYSIPELVNEELYRMIRKDLLKITTDKSTRFSYGTNDKSNDESKDSDDKNKSEDNEDEVYINDNDMLVDRKTGKELFW